MDVNTAAKKHTEIFMKTDFEITPEMAAWKKKSTGILPDDPTWQEIVCLGLFRLNQAFKYNEYNKLREEVKQYFNVA